MLCGEPCNRDILFFGWVPWQRDDTRNIFSARKSHWVPFNKSNWTQLIKGSSLIKRQLPANTDLVSRQLVCIFPLFIVPDPTCRAGLRRIDPDGLRGDQHRTCYRYVAKTDAENQEIANWRFA
jgi:hypothetical protein